MFEIMRRFTPTVEEYSIDEGFADIGGMDRYFRRPYIEIARTLQQTIHRELDLTVSVGLSLTKSLAKIASDFSKAVRSIRRCRTSELGGHIHECDHCGSELPVYNGCQTRHCPSCQGGARRKWLEARHEELLPVEYFHVVFTLPHSLNALIDANRKLLLSELFSVTGWVLQRFAHDPQWRLEGELGYLALLHTWTQRLQEHFHLHCLVPGGVWREATGEWKPCRRKWLFKKDALADAFRNCYIKRLRALQGQGKLAYSGGAAALADESAWEALLSALESQRWIVYPKATPGKPAKALEYLARYTHKVAISDSRIKSIENGHVTYTWRDRSDNNTEKHNSIPEKALASARRPAVPKPRKTPLRGIRETGKTNAHSRRKKRNTMTMHRVIRHLSSPVYPTIGTLPHSNRRLRPTSFYPECHSIKLDPQCNRGTLVALKIKR